MPSIIQYALGFEAFGNVVAASAFIFYPSFCLSHALPLSPIPASTRTLLQAFGAITYALSVPIVLCLRNGPHVPHTRKMVYYILGAGEALLIPLFLYKGLAEGEDSGFDNQWLLSAAVNLVPPLGWRLWCILWRPAWFGTTEIENEGEKAMKI
jgi:hypothetical protein